MVIHKTNKSKTHPNDISQQQTVHASCEHFGLGHVILHWVQIFVKNTTHIN